MRLTQAEAELALFENRRRLLPPVLAPNCAALLEVVDDNLASFEALLNLTPNDDADVPADELVEALTTDLAVLERCQPEPGQDGFPTQGMTSGARFAFGFLGVLGLVGLGILIGTRRG